MASRFHQVFDSEITGTLGSAGRSAAEAMQIERPAPGSVQIADVQRALAIKFGFDLADVKIMAVDVDLVLVFPDGGRLVLPGLALSLLSAEPPQIAFNEEAIEPHEFISRLGDVKLIDQVPALSLASVEAEKPAEAQAESQARGQGPGSSDTAPVPSGVGTAQGAQEGRADADFPERLTSRPLIEVPRPLTRAVPEASPGKSNSGQYDEPPGDVVNKAQISFRLLGVTDTPPIGAEGDAWVFTNSFAAVPAERDPSLAAQTRGTRLLGTERDDILNAADFSRVAPGQSMRRVELSAIAIGREDEVASMIRVILPRGLRIEGVEPQGSYYEFATNGQNSIAFNLIYDLPGADIALGANGYFGTVKAMIVEMQYGADFYTGKQHFVIAPRSGEGALEMQLDATTQAAILWSNPPDTEIFAGAGHDTIRASASADMIDGGAGIDIVSYSQSHFGVEASLATGGTKAYALGDTYRNVEGLEGSAFADHLIGDANDNILIGRRGADTLDGAGGRDLADYSASNSAIIVNLNADSQLGGDAHGDVLIAIEDVRATQFRDELIGNEFANRLWGEGGNDLIQGGAGHDTLDGGLGTDTLDYSDLGVADSVSVTLHSDNSTQAFVTRQGQSEIDHITGFENVMGGQGNDTLIGSVRANLLRGGAGDDWLSGQGGPDTLDGGEGFDTASFAALSASQSLLIALNDQGHGTAEIRDAQQALIETHQLIAIEAIEGGAGDDQIIGNQHANRLSGGLGADLLQGGGGADTLDGGLGLDTLEGGAGDDLYHVADAHDLIIEHDHEGQDSARLTANFVGASYVLAQHVETLDASAVQQSLTLTGNDSANLILGGAGNDMLIGGLNADTLRGGAGDDVYVVESVDDVIDETSPGASGLDTIRLVNGALTSYSLLGRDGVENLDASALQAGVSLIGNDHVNIITGSDFNDTLQAHGLNDQLIGGLGDDVYRVLSNSDQLIELVNGGDDRAFIEANFSGPSYTLAAHVETLDASAKNGGFTLIGNQTGATLIGGAGGDLINGGGAGDLLQGGGGADTLDGGLGLDTLEGGAGDDLYHVADAHDLIIEHDHEGQDSARLTANFVGASYVLAQHVETLDASAVQQSLTLTGNDSANLILGGAGNDMLIGGLNADTLRGGAGDDVYVIESAQDVMIEVANEGQDSVLLQTGFNSNAFQLADHIETLDASDLQQGMVLTGNAQNNLIIGTLSHDTLIGHEGIDTLRGGAGDDLYSVDHENDVIDETSAGSGGTDTIRLTGQQISSFSIAATIAGVTSGRGNIEILDASLLTQNLTLNGNSLANRLIGGSGNDSITDSNGNDTLNGGLGNDTLNAGGGFDRYQFDWSAQIGQGWGQDVIFFYEPADDRIEIRNIGFAATSADALELVTITNVSFGVTTITLKSALAFGDVQTITLNHRAGKENIAVTATDFLFVRDPNLDWIAGTSSANTLSGTLGNDTILGLAGNDLIEASLGADFIDGGTGLDTLSYAGFSSAIVVNLQNATAQLVAPGVSHHIMGIERIIGSNFGDLIQGGAQDDIVLGGLGHDTLIGGAGFDTLDYSYLTTALTINLAENGAQQTIIAAAGIDEDVVREFEHIIGGSGHDSLTGNSNNNNLTGGVGNDTMSGGSGNDTLDGGAGQDTLNYSYLTTALTLALSANGAQQTVTAISGSDVDVIRNFENIMSGSGHDVLTGNASANLIDGGAGNDSILGGSGDDTLIGGGGNDTIDGGTGLDAIDYSYLTTGLTLALAAGGMQQTVIAVAGTDIDVIAGIENIIGGSANDMLTGNDSANIIRGGFGNDTLNGAAGLDTIDYSYLTTGLTLVLAAAGAQQTVTAAVGDVDVISNFENIIGGSGDDNLRGNELANVIHGGAGNDTISTGGANDTIDGGDGVDTLTYSYLSTGLTLTLAENGAQQTVTAVAGSDVDVIRNFENIMSGSGHDVLTGNASANLIDGGAGDDSILGGLGDDILIGGAGNDTLDGGTGLDTIDYSYLTTGLTLVLAAAGAQQTVTAALGDVDVISNFENVTGGSGHDSITGNSGNNIINGGGAGIDRLNGGGGDDSLGLHYQQLTNGSFVDGGAGIDQFNFSTLSASTQYSVTMTQLDQLLDNVEELHFGWSNNRISLSVDLTAGSADRTALAGIAGGNAVKIIYNDVNSAVQHQDQISVSNAVASDTCGTAGTSGYTQNFYADAGKTQLLLQLIAA